MYIITLENSRGGHLKPCFAGKGGTHIYTTTTFWSSMSVFQGSFNVLCWLLSWKGMDLFVLKCQVK